MDADLDTLAAALYVRVDDLLKASPEHAPWRPQVGIAPGLSDAEAVTLAVLQALLGYASEARWLRYARAHLRHLFPYLPHQPGYNKRLRKLAATMADRPGARFFKPLRQVIESINDTLKGQLDLERHGGHTPAGVLARVLQRILALTAAIWHNDNTGQAVKRSLLAYDH